MSLVNWSCGSLRLIIESIESRKARHRLYNLGIRCGKTKWPHYLPLSCWDFFSA
jgi:hypothetical protein